MRNNPRSIDDPHLPAETAADRLASASDVFMTACTEAATVRRLVRRRFAAAVEARAAESVQAAMARVFAAGTRVGVLDPRLTIEAHGGFGTADRVRVAGRVVAARPAADPRPDDGGLDNAERVARDLLVYGIGAATVRARLGARTTAATTGPHGYFQCELPGPGHRGGWHEVELELVRGGPRATAPVRARTEILVPAATAGFAVVSDIDDTLLESHADGWLRMSWLALTGNALTRRACDGAVAFLRALAAGVSSSEDNPVFYLSKTPWNLHRFLREFLARHGFPKGPLLLRGLGPGQPPPGDFKRRALDELLATYRHLPFVLIGDSGEDDPEVYLDVVARHPGRVRVIFIRNLDGRASARAAAWRDKALRFGTDLVVIGDGSDGLAHARITGLAALPQRRDPRPARAEMVRASEPLSTL